ncbi:MAG: ATP-binding protein [Patescibacteria group bacterium]
MEYKRLIQNRIEGNLFKKKAIIIYGARQVGKTTLVKKIQEKYSENSLYLNADEPDIRYSLENKTSTEIKKIIGDNTFLIIDEAQRVNNIGLTLKLIIDNFPLVQVIATGSSSFELSNSISEPLTGRKFEFHLYPLSIEEMLEKKTNIEVNRLLENILLFGMYPEIVSGSSLDSQMKIEEIASSYLFKDILQFQNIRNSEILTKLLQALALQIGSEVSYNELANLLNIDKDTVSRYIQILEKAFIIFSLKPYSRNLRKEIGKLRKIYFYDLGIRNAIIKNFNVLSLRQDTGELWENFIISERIKYNNNRGIHINNYFWRTYDKKEIDYIEDVNGKLEGFEIKYSSAKFKKYIEFLNTYKESSISLVNKDNFLDFVS